MIKHRSPSPKPCTTPSPTDRSSKSSKSSKNNSKRRRRKGKIIRAGDQDPGMPEPKKQERKRDTANWTGIMHAQDFVKNYADIGLDGIRAEFKREVEGYKNPIFDHTAFDANPTKNRNNALLTCLDDTRVTLSTGQYINASLSPDLYNTLDRQYILTQVPIESTMNDFWQMNFEQNARYIFFIMPDQQTAAKLYDVFWPEKEGESKVFGKITLKFVKTESHTKGWYSNGQAKTWTKVEASCEGNARIKHMWVAQYHQWDPTQTRDCVHTMLWILDIMDKLDDREKPTRPTVVLTDECSGTARAALLMVLDTMCETITRPKKGIAMLPHVCKWARNCRNGVIRSEDEYIFIVKAVVEFICGAINSPQFAELYKKVWGIEWKNLQKT